MMCIRLFFKQVTHILTGPAIYPKEDMMEPWEDRVIRLALQHWVHHIGRSAPKWDQFRHIVEIEQ
jgi:hypothetical protein